MRVGTRAYAGHEQAADGGELERPGYLFGISPRPNVGHSAAPACGAPRREKSLATHSFLAILIRTWSPSLKHLMREWMISKEIRNPRICLDLCLDEIM